MQMTSRIGRPSAGSYGGITAGSVLMGGTIIETTSDRLDAASYDRAVRLVDLDAEPRQLTRCPTSAVYTGIQMTTGEVHDRSCGSVAEGDGYSANAKATFYLVVDRVRASIDAMTQAAGYPLDRCVYTCSPGLSGIPDWVEGDERRHDGLAGSIEQLLSLLINEAKQSVMEELVRNHADVQAAAIKRLSSWAPMQRTDFNDCLLTTAQTGTAEVLKLKQTYGVRADSGVDDTTNEAEITGALISRLSGAMNHRRAGALGAASTVGVDMTGYENNQGLLQNLQSTMTGPRLSGPI